MSALAIVLIVVGAVLLVLLVGGAIAIRRRSDGVDYARHVAEADHALEQARAADKGWDRDVLERAARSVISERRPGWRYEELHLVLVDDRPGVVNDRAHLVAVGDDGEEARVVLTREPGGDWVAEEIR